MILLIDNYDSFTFNIYQYVASEGIEVKVVRNDQITIARISEMTPEAIILSPGPGAPSQAGICPEIVKAFHRNIPILGICLGHQVIAETLGGRISQGGTVKHGKTSLITHNGNGLFSYLPQPLEVMRYHSLVIDRRTLPGELKITATSLEDNEIMAIKHRQRPVYGIQFHPESIGTVTGKKMIRNFLKEIRKESYHEILS
ncbi:anthranilate synthase component II [Lentibacillus jeotgali]|uniref:anthranilate synthase component II n=1 Tax=Lentibacillus jeotgali TaxID=558169 RepID=UPI00026273C4|nr:aminodeoxychorismate/anthranilate synthase component II [Lentibacillus jeotgali]